MNNIDIQKIVTDFLANSSDEELLAELGKAENQALAHVQGSVLPRPCQVAFTFENDVLTVGLAQFQRRETLPICAGVFLSLDEELPLAA